jgi:serine/threonine-protein kinase RsbW
MSSILVIDDEIEICELLQVALEMSGHQVQIAQSATYALKCLEEREFDFVIIDMIMPEISGLEMIRIINEKYPRTLTILTTGLQTQNIIKQALEHGAYNFANKPFSLQEITNIIDVGSRIQTYSFNAQIIQPYLVHQLHFVLPSQKNLMEEVAGTIANVAKMFDFPKKLVAMNIPLTVDELFLNAVIHGNKEDESKTVSIKVVLDAKQISITVADQGEGFDWMKVVNRNTPTDLENEGGRGIFLVRHYVDQISYNQTGNSVTVVINRHRTLPQTSVKSCEEPCEVNASAGDVIRLDDNMMLNTQTL